jgi:hypothetical protein
MMAACACPITRRTDAAGVAVGRHNWTFAGSDGGRRAAAIYTLIETAKLNDIDPQAWLTDVLARLQDHPAKRINELPPWNWKRERQQKAAVAAPDIGLILSTSKSAALAGCVPSTSIRSTI